MANYFDPDLEQEDFGNFLQSQQQQAPMPPAPMPLPAAPIAKQASYSPELVGPPAPPSDPLGDILKGYGADDRQKALDDATAQKKSLGWREALAALGEGIAGRSPLGASSVFNAKRAEIDANTVGKFDTGKRAALEKYSLGREIGKNAIEDKNLKDDNDPNSEASKMAQQTARSLGYNGDLSGFTAQKFKVYAPILEKKFGVDAVKQARIAAAADKTDAHNSKLDDDLVKGLGDAINPNKSRGGNLAKNQQRLDQTEYLKGLYTEIGTGKKRNLTGQEMEELGIGLDRLFSGAAPASSQINALVPKTIRGNANAIVQWISNKPQGADQQAFVKRMADTVDREAKVARDIVIKDQRQMLPAYSKLKDHDLKRYKQILQVYPGLDPEEDPPVQNNAPAGAGNQPPPPVSGEIQIHEGRKYKYKGGNPADPNSWDAL